MYNKLYRGFSCIKDFSFRKDLLNLQVGRDLGITIASFGHSERFVNPSRSWRSNLGLKVSCSGV